MLLRTLLGLGVILSAGNAWAQGESVPAPKPATEVAHAQTSVYHSGWGAIQADGSLKGRVMTVGEAGAVQAQGNTVVTLSKDMMVLATVQTSEDGSFTLTGLVPGVYEIAAESADCYGIVSFQAVDGSQLGQAPAMDIYAATMNRARVDEVLQSLWAPQDQLGAPRPFVELVAPLQPATQSQRVSIRGGVVSGQVAFENDRVIPEAHVVKVFKQGKLMATAAVDRDGRFSFPATAPGAVDVVLGGGAFATLGLELVDDTRVSANGTQSAKFVSTAANEALAVASTLVIPAAGGAPGAGMDGMLPPPLPLAGEPLPLMGDGFAPMGGGFGPMGGGGGGFGGGSGGGGGIGGGLGGIGGLLGIAGLALGVVALADEDDGFSTPVATPVVVVSE